MSRGARLAVSGLIVRAAACVAIPLRKKDQQQDQSPKSLVSAPKHQRVKSSALSIESPGAIGSESPANKLLVRPRIEGESSDQMPKVNGLGATLHASHPDIPASFPNLSPSDPAQENSKPSETDLPAKQVVDSSASEIDSANEPSSVEVAASPARYRIVDGDTLETIAQRLLGSASRASEIYAANRDALDSPALLPIGLEIVIPSSPAAVPNDNGTDPVAIDSSLPSPGNSLLPIPPIGS